MRFLSVSEVARHLRAKPKDISDLFYQRRLDDARCPIVAGRRLIPEEYVSEIEAMLRDLGRLRTHKPNYESQVSPEEGQRCPT